MERLWLIPVLVVLLVAVFASFRLNNRSDALPRKDAVKNAYIVEIDMKSDVELRPIVLDRKVAGSKSFDQIAKGLKPYAAINGTFYDSNLQPLGDIVVDGKMINRGKYPSAIAVCKDGTIELVRKIGERDWSGYKTVLSAGPMLIQNGKIRIDPTADGFTTRAKDIRATRSGVGLTKSGKLLLVVSKDSLRLKDFAQLMKGLGAVDAMNLDGGPACALYKDGKTLVNPTLTMTNLLLVYKNNSKH